MFIYKFKAKKVREKKGMKKISRMEECKSWVWVWQSFFPPQMPEIGPKASDMLGKHSNTESYPQSPKAPI
jgi:hypothetical protein